MKRLIAVILTAASITAFGHVPALAAPGPGAPSWVDESEYVVFENDNAYSDVNWKIIEGIRQIAERGGTDADLTDEMRNFLNSCGTWYATFGMRLEGGLCALKLATNEETMPDYIAGRALNDYFSMFNRMRDNDKGKNIAELWYMRARILTPPLDDPLFGERSEQMKYMYVGETMEKWGYDEEDIFNTPVMKTVTDEYKKYVYGRIADYKNRIKVTIDGGEVEFSDALPVIINDRTMVPVRRLAELMGAEVEWNNDAREITAVRAGTTVVMHVDDNRAYVDGEEVVMDAAPCIIGSRTFIPARYISEFLGQRVEWLPERREVAISENKDIYKNSNLENWVKAMGAVLTYINNGNPTIFPGYSRSGDMLIEYSEHNLTGWGIKDRSELVTQITLVTLSGHNDSFFLEAQLSGSSFSEALAAKWGDRGIMCWDLFRVANLIQWGYGAGYLSYDEAMAFAEPAALMLSENFSSWDEAYENYVDGYNWWSHNAQTDTKSTDRWEKYLEVKKECEETYGENIFDDNLFRMGVIGSEAITHEV